MSYFHSQNRITSDQRELVTVYFLAFSECTLVNMYPCTCILTHIVLTMLHIQQKYVICVGPRNLDMYQRLGVKNMLTWCP